MTVPDTAELRRLLEAATPGPWLLHRDATDARLDQARVTDESMRLLFRLGADPEQRMSQPDAALIVAAVNSLPSLLAEIERLRGEE